MYHPDKNPEGGDIFIQIKQSYKILSNPYLRIIYDHGQLDNYLNLKDNPDSLIKIFGLIKLQVTSTYSNADLKQDLDDMNLDKIAATMVKAYYDNDDVFKKTYTILVLGVLLAKGLSLAWYIIKFLTKVTVFGYATYYIFYRRILF